MLFNTNQYSSENLVHMAPQLYSVTQTKLCKNN